MIKRLRKKLIAAAMISLVAVLTIIMTAINLLNYHSVVTEADGTLQMLNINDGKFPIRDKMPQNMRPMSPELPYESRFFWVLLSADGKILSSDTDHIAAIDKTEAEELAAKVIKSGKVRGFTDRYRYLVSTDSDGTRVIFLDCTRSLSTSAQFLALSISISVLGIGAVFVLILLLSGRIVKPVSESYEKQKQFITDAGHELKTPVTVIDADAEVLELEIGSNDWLDDIRRQTARLKTLTNDLVYLSRMEEQPKLMLIDFSISDVAAEVAHSFKSMADTQGKQFNISIEPMVSFVGDEKAIAQLINILLDNAFKYSPENGEVTLELSRKLKGVCIEVTNTTVSPVDRDSLSHFFDRFYREDSSRSTSGYGIGLSIAKAVTAAHKGKITATAPDQNTIKITAILN